MSNDDDPKHHLAVEPYPDEWFRCDTLAICPECSRAQTVTKAGWQKCAYPDCTGNFKVIGDDTVEKAPFVH